MSLLAMLLLALTSTVSAAARDWSTYEQIIPEGISKEFVDVEYTSRERESLAIKASGYRLVVQLEGPRISEFWGGGRSANFLLAPASLQAEIEGRQLSSSNWPGKARLNIWRHGPYFYEVHVLDFPLCSADGTEGPAAGELIFYCYPNKFHLQAIVRPKDGASLSNLRMAFMVSGKTLPPISDAAGTSRTVFTSTRGIFGIVFGPEMKPIVEGGLDRSTFGVERKVTSAGAFSLNMAWLGAGSASEAENAAILECRPLEPSRIQIIEGGGFEGYDRIRGYYVLRTSWTPPAGFEPNWANPNRYLGVRFKIIGDDYVRRLYFKNYSFSAGCVEAGVLTDPFGFPIPIPVQACKNFGGEYEEPDDTPFSETYFPLQIAPRQSVELVSLHLFQNWGNHMLKQVSSIRFFEHYYHLSTGTTETTCYVPFTKFAHGGVGYTIADFRGMSQNTWPGQPQHDHVALIGFLQYKDADETQSSTSPYQGWRHLRYTGTEFHHISPNFAHFTMNYLTDDGKIKASVEVFEIPQTDETRSFVHLRYDVMERVTIAGDARNNLRFLNANTDITRNEYSKVAFLDRDNKPVEIDLRYDGTYTLEGVRLGSDYPFVCMYGSDKGNSAFIVRRFDGQIEGKPLKELAASTIGYPPRPGNADARGVADQFLTVPDPRVELQPGDWFEADVILMPYGNAASDWHQPDRERRFYGSEAPKVEVEWGRKIADFPSTVEATHGVARFSVSGGENYLPLIITGMPRYKAPMLWRDWGPEGAEAKRRLPSEILSSFDFLDQQVLGNDWYQVSGEGPYTFVFLVRTRAGQRHRYMVTQATSFAEIKSVRMQNGVITVEAEKPDQMEIVSPRLFLGLRNRLEAENPLVTASGRAISASSAPFFAGIANGTAEISGIEIAGDRAAFDAEGSGRLSLTFPGLEPGGRYLLSSREKDQWELVADGSGTASIEIAIAGRARLSFAPKSH